MQFLGIPVWLFALMMAASVLTGLTIRFWLDRRKARLEQERVLRQKEEKKLAKRAQKRAKKAAKSRKNSKPATADDASALTSSDEPDTDHAP